MAITGSYQDHHLTQFTDELSHELQKRGSLLEQTVTMKSVSGNQTEFEILGIHTEELKTSRGQEKVYQDQNYQKRRITFDFITADVKLDKVDLLDLIGNPTSEIMNSMVSAVRRREDTLIFNALSGNALVIENGSSSNTALPSASKVAVNDHLYDPAGGTNDIGLTGFKLKNAKKILTSAYAYDGTEPLYCIAPDSQLMALTMDDQIVSADYRGTKPLEGPGVDKSISGFLDITFIAYEDTDLVNTTDQTAYLFPKSAVFMGERQGLTVKIAEDVRFPGNPDTISVTMDLGAVRAYEEKVIQIACDPSTFVSA